MSYNISRWKTKKLKGFRIPFAALEDLDGPTLDLKSGVLTFGGDLSEGFELVGRSEGEWLAVAQLKHYGEGSGSQFERLETILKQSTGVLIATLVWEGGDSTSRLVVKNGVVEHEDIDI